MAKKILSREEIQTLIDNVAPASRESGSNSSWRSGLITAKALQTKTFAPVRIIVPGLIPEGVTILAGKPKIGKS
jgi:hypothetical protein